MATIENEYVATPPAGYTPTKRDLVHLAKYFARGDLLGNGDAIGEVMSEDEIRGIQGWDRARFTDAKTSPSERWITHHLVRMGDDSYAYYGDEWPSEFSEEDVAMAKAIAESQVAKEMLHEIQEQKESEYDPDYPEDSYQETLADAIGELQSNKNAAEAKLNHLMSSGMSDEMA